MREGKGGGVRTAEILILCIMMVLSGFLVGQLTNPGDFPQLLEVVNKTEQGGKYYIEVSMEVSPEEYIGLDVGDTFEGSLKCYF